MTKNHVLGIDIGGSGVKGAIVDLKKGEFVTERFRIPTPSPHNPQTLIGALQEVVDAFKWKGILGCGFPGVVRGQIIDTAANIGGRNFIGINLAELIGQKTGCEAWVLNDADAAGIAEMKFGAGKGKKGVVMMMTVGTGIGVSLFTDGVLVPNLELGHLKVRDKATGKNIAAEKICSDAVRKSKDLQWKQWAERFNKYINYVHDLCWPDLIILGGGIASKSDKFIKYLDVKSDIAIAKLENRAGIIGAAYQARKVLK